MTKTISGADLRAKLLARKDKPVSAEAAWLDVLGTPGHRMLLATIAQRSPQSIGELSALVDRAQPNVSRSLAALVRAGLITIESKGRMSVPSLTDLGRKKANEIGRPESADEVDATAPINDGALAGDAAAFVFVASRGGADTVGSLFVNAPRSKQIVLAVNEEDLGATAHRLIDHWWRIWCRRDAPFRVGNFSSEDAGVLTLLFGSKGSRIERTVRWQAGSHPPITFDIVDSVAFQQEVLQSVLQPVGKLASRNGAMFDELFSSKLARLHDSYEQPPEHEFCRTAGALQISPYDLTNDAAEVVRGLIAAMPEEDARLDFASTMDFEETEVVSRQIERDIVRLSDLNRLAALPDALGALNGEVSGFAKNGLKPWQKGTSAAKALRQHFKMGADYSVGDLTSLARLFGADRFELNEIGSQEILAFQAEVQGAPTMLVQNEWGALNSAFFLARAVGDYLVFQSKKSCVSNKYTDRQAVGRAFAAEFMAPAEGVVFLIDEGELSMTKVAAHYGVSVDVVNHQYQNNYAG